MFRRVLAVVAMAATAVMAAATFSSDALARPAGAHAAHAGSFAGHGYHGAVARHGAVAAYHGGPYRIGHRYHGGIWYGAGPHWWRGRWYAYGVGSCWLLSPIGYVWVCG